MTKFVRLLAFLAIITNLALGDSKFMCKNSETNLYHLLSYTDMRECILKSYCTCSELLTTCVFGPDQDGKLETEQVT